MGAFWIEFKARPPMCHGTAADEGEALAAAAALGDVVRCRRLPYPASPRIDADRNNFSREGCPSFCYRPGRCVGRSACPNDPSCTS